MDKKIGSFQKIFPEIIQTSKFPLRVCTGVVYIYSRTQAIKKGYKNSCDLRILFYCPSISEHDPLCFYVDCMINASVCSIIRKIILHERICKHANFKLYDKLRQDIGLTVTTKIGEGVSMLVYLHSHG